MSSPVRRLLAGAVLVLALLATATPADARPRITADQERVQELVNRSRNNNGVRTNLQITQPFSDKATQWARHLVACQCLEHRAGPYGANPGWCSAAENVGRGYSFVQIQNAFMASTLHRNNILNREFTTIGVGVAEDANGEIFVVQAFQDRAC
jgi:uncharacterized protein YkwD